MCATLTQSGCFESGLCVPAWLPYYLCQFKKNKKWVMKFLLTTRPKYSPPLIDIGYRCSFWTDFFKKKCAAFQAPSPILCSAAHRTGTAYWELSAAQRLCQLKWAVRIARLDIFHSIIIWYVRYYFLPSNRSQFICSLFFILSMYRSLIKYSAVHCASSSKTLFSRFNRSYKLSNYKLHVGFMLGFVLDIFSMSRTLTMWNEFYLLNSMRLS